MSPNAIAFRIPGPPRILVIDITNNRKGFEHKMSSDLMGKLKEAGVPLACEEVVLARTDDEYAAVFDRNLNFNILLLVAHGAPDLNEVKASEVAIPGGRSNWFQLASLSSSLSDKMVCLAVCHGFCRDAIDAFVRDGHFSLALVGSISSLSSIEVVTFFPRSQHTPQCIIRRIAASGFGFAPPFSSESEPWFWPPSSLPALKLRSPAPSCSRTH